MTRLFKLVWIPLSACAFLAIGCGVPIPESAITATAIAEREARASAETRALQPASAAQARDPQALDAQMVSSAEGPLPTREPAEPAEATPADPATPTPAAVGSDRAQADAGEPQPDESGAPQTDDSPTPEFTPEPEATPEADATVDEPAPEEAKATETPVPEPAAAVEPATSQDHAGRLISLINLERSERGLSLLTPNTIMSDAAGQYAARMGSEGFFGHYAPDGSSPSARLAAAGYRGQYAGEALTAGQETPERALASFLASSPHAAILLSPGAVEIGVGYAYADGSTYEDYWVVVTGVP